MIPLRDENPTLHTSFATIAIVAANVAVWVLVQGLGAPRELLESVWNYGLIPAELLGHVEPGDKLQVSQGLYYVFETPNWWTPLTSMFMHGGWFHIIGNMWFLSVFGDNVEDAMGSIRFILFYLVCGLVAAAAQVVTAPASTIPMVGASGAIGGVMGAYLMLYPRAPVHMLVFIGFFITRVVVPAFFMLGYWFLLQLIAGSLSPKDQGGVAFWAHVGGFAAGMLLVHVFCDRERLAKCRGRRGRIQRMMRRA